MIIDGKALAKQRLEALLPQVLALKSRGVIPNLAVVLVGNDPASEVYVTMKAKRAAELGIMSEVIKLPDNSLETDLLGEIRRLNDDPKFTGVLIQLPFPTNSPTEMSQRLVLDAISPEKDGDCLTSQNIGLLSGGEPRFYPATVKGVLILLEHILKLDLLGKGSSYRKMKYLLAGSRVTIVGRSEIVGKPLALTLINMGATVTVCNAKTGGLESYTKTADILISAAGVPKLITAEMVQPGAIVIDVGITRISKTELVGDVDFEPVAKIASAITPVPGGTGPLTISSLLENTVTAATS